MTPLQHDVLALIRQELTSAFILLPGALAEERIAIGISGPAYVQLAIHVNGRGLVNASIRESMLPDVAETVAHCLSMIEWDDPVSVVCTTADGVTHILKSIGGRTRPAA